MAGAWHGAAVDGKQLLAAWAAAERRGLRGRGQRGGAEAVAELPGDAWSGAGARAGLGRHGNGVQRRRYCGGRENRGGRKGGGILGSYLQLQELQGLQCKKNFLLF
jgi:hypothetical protein